MRSSRIQTPNSTGVGPGTGAGTESVDCLPCAAVRGREGLILQRLAFPTLSARFAGTSPIKGEKVCHAFKILTLPGFSTPLTLC